MAAPTLLLSKCKRFYWTLEKLHRICTTRCGCRHYMTGNQNVLKLHERGIFENVFPEERSPDLLRALKGATVCCYSGFDPTADSLHIGNLMVIIALLHCQRAGHQTIALLGGATAQIGDPSGKTKERSPLELDTIQQNVCSIESSLKRIFHNHKEYFCQNEKDIQPIKIVNNAEWYAKRNVVEFLSTVGRHFRMGTMLGRHSVQTRLNSPEGMNFTEFTYQMFQAYDWLHLYRQYNCLIQVGGGDQMGNIVAGHEFISRVTKKDVFGLTVPLIKSTSGDKLGKTAGNAVWLNSDKTSPFELYQFYLNLPDANMERFLKIFTFLSDEDVARIITNHKNKPELRKAQKKLAENVTLLIHGEDGLQSAVRCTEALFHGSAESLARLSMQDMTDLFRSAPTKELFLEPGTTVFDTVMKAGCFNREVDAERVIKAGGVYINHQRVTEADYVLIPGEHILPNNVTLVRVGKRNNYIVKWLGA
ncbi:Tyrosine--tRNA ligase, mitochondrial [Lamellibrachia satsuma]|nr:Tyrosine--tRNA ligase, mitochondrial [Lamellibrachia satsuma]